MERPTVVLGAGPAGLAAAYVLARAGRRVTVLESGTQVGGLAKTVVRDGYRFDLGGHRFFTKSEEVSQLWWEVLGDELHERPRLSRIYWNGRFLHYPLRATDVVRNLGAVELARVMGSYAWAATRPSRTPESFEDWVVARFGRRLFELFFRAYTEKVWGVPTSEIRAEWAAQRIRGLSLPSAAWAALTGGDGAGEIRTLVERFLYPRLGPGEMWEAMAARVEGWGGEIRLGTEVRGLDIREGSVEAIHTAAGERFEPAHVISSLPLNATVAAASPAAPEPVRVAARELRYRDFLTVALVLEGPDPFPDNWIYVHEPDVDVCRIQNYRAWSPAMVPDPDRSCVGLEYFCFQGDRLWTMPDEELVRLAASELRSLGVDGGARVERGFVERVPLAYPIYDGGCFERLRCIRDWLETIDNLQQVGRNGLHRYNNSDHSSLTGMRAAQAVLTGDPQDIWSVNTDSAYHEEGRRAQPYRRSALIPPPVPERGS